MFRAVLTTIKERDLMSACEGRRDQMTTYKPGSAKNQ
jgi:hypothetical protein